MYLLSRDRILIFSAIDARNLMHWLLGNSRYYTIVYIDIYIEYVFYISLVFGVTFHNNN